MPTERWVTAEDMAENLKKAKMHRKNKLGTFTRKQKHLQTMVDGGAEGESLQKLYEELNLLYKDLEKAHEDYCLLLEDTEDETEDS